MELEPDRWRSFTPGSTRDRFFKLNPKRGHRDPAPWHRHPMHYCHATDRDRMARAPSSPVAFSCHLTWMPPALAGCTHRRLARDAAAAQACLHAAALRCALSTSRLTGQSRMGLLGPGPWWRHLSPTCFARRSRGRRAAVPRPLAVDVAVSHARSTTHQGDEIMDRWITDSAIQPSFMISLDPVWSGPYAYGLPACSLEEEDVRTRRRHDQSL